MHILVAASARLLLASSIAWVPVSAAFAQGAELMGHASRFSAAQEGALPASEQARLRTMRGAKGVKHAYVTRMSPESLNSNVVSVAIRDGRTLVITKGREVRGGPNRFGWTGRTQTGGYATFSTVGDEFHGLIQDRGVLLEVRRLGGDRYAVTEVDQRALPPDHLPRSVVRAAPSAAQDKHLAPAAAPRSAAAAADPVVNIFVAYTPLAAAGQGNNMSAALDSTLAVLNQSLGARALKFQIVGTTVVNTEYPTGVAALTALQRLTSVHVARDASNADLIVLIAAFTDVCGVSLTNPDHPRVPVGPLKAMSVVATDCMNTNFSMAHEIGHLLGLIHNIEVNDGLSSSHPAARGFESHIRTGNEVQCWRTIMALPTYTDCTWDGGRWGIFSDPNERLMIYGVSHPTGSQDANANYVLGVSGPAATNWRNTKLAPFSQAVSNILMNTLILD
jgi:hypothetical protein